MRHEAFLGRKVAGRFTITRFLGQGGMASVFVAERDAEPRQVAIKIMNPELTADREFVRRFQREAKAAARVKHPNSVKIYQYGVEGSLSYIVMELLTGDDLYALLERHGAISQARAVRILAEVCDALMVAHEMGVVHRDLKPENIMVIADPTHPHGERVKVLDFGIAKILDADPSGDEPDARRDPMSVVTRAGTFIGTPAYMSPEQCGLMPVDPRADLYTCGVLLFQLVTGRLPFEGETPLHTATLHIHAPVPAPSSLAPTIDHRLEALLLKALEKKPADRYQTARELGAALRILLADIPDVAVGQGPLSARQTSSLLSRSAMPGGSPLPPLPRAPAYRELGLQSPQVISIESARTLVSGGAGPEGGPAPAVVLHPPGGDPSSTLEPQTLDPAHVGEPPRWTSESVPEISLQLPSWSSDSAAALIAETPRGAGDGLAGSSAADDAGDDDSTLTMVRQDELRAPPKVRVNMDAGVEPAGPPNQVRDVKATLRSAADFGLSTPEKKTEVGVISVEPPRVSPPTTPLSPQFDGGADGAPRRFTHTVRMTSPYSGVVDSAVPTVQPGALRPSSPPALDGAAPPVAAGFRPTTTLASPTGGLAGQAGGLASPTGGLAGQAGGLASPTGGLAGPAGGLAGPVGTGPVATGTPLAFADTLMATRSPIPARHSAIPANTPLPVGQSMAPPEPTWLAGKRGLIIGFVAGMLLTSLAMYLLMRYV